MFPSQARFLQDNLRSSTTGCFSVFLLTLDDLPYKHNLLRPIFALIFFLSLISIDGSKIFPENALMNHR